MKPLLFLCIALLYSLNNSAQKIENDSIIKLEPVIVYNKIKKKLLKVELDGYPAYNGLHGIRKIVSLVPNIPAGKLKYVNFYFNTGLVNLLKKKLNINYKDVELGLLIYGVTDDGKLGEVLSENEIRFIVEGEDRGSYKLNISQLDISVNKIYIGFEILSEISQTEHDIYVRYNESEDASTYTMYTYKNMEGKWGHSKRDHFKLTLGVEQ